MAGHAFAAIDLHAENCEAARLVRRIGPRVRYLPHAPNGGALLFPLFDPPL
jgi:hypothetical protein